MNVTNGMSHILNHLTGIIAVSMAPKANFKVTGIYVLYLLLFALGDEDFPCDENFMGVKGSGILTSDNYPFNYRNANHANEHRFCIYRIYFGSDAPASAERKICFTFYRFLLEDSTGCSNDYLQFPHTPDHNTLKYCGSGHWSNSGSSSTHDNVFSSEFCWMANGNIFDIRFSADTRLNGTGFYATFTITEDTIQRTIQNNSAPIQRETTTQDANEATFANDVATTRDLVTVSIPTTPVPGSNESSLRQKRNALTEAPCSSQEYTCFNRKCIPQSQKCNSQNDCGDNSDENYLHARCAVRQDIEACTFDGLSDEVCYFSSSYGWYRDDHSIYGPRLDHTYEQLKYGHFFFAHYPEDVSTGYLNYVPDITRNEPHCLMFYFFMTGYVGTLQLWMKTPPSDGRSHFYPIWRRNTNYGQAWIRAEISVPLDAFPIEELTFQGIENGHPDWSDNPSIDDISFLPGPCIHNDVSCLFELDMCGWSVDMTMGDITWQRKYGSSETAGTGPESDADGNEEGYYLLMDASQRLPADKAVLVSRPLSHGHDDLKCFSFSYHMYGDDVSWLLIRVIHYDNQQGATMWSINGNQGTEWKLMVLDIYNVEGPFQIVIEGHVGTSAKSDIALDNFMLVDGHCNVATPTTPPVSTLPPEPVTCKPGHFQCEDTTCIQSEWVCDGRFDCDDNSDEANCSGMALSTGAVVGLCLGVAIMLIILIVVLVIVKKRHSFNANHCQPALPDPSLYYDPAMDHIDRMHDPMRDSNPPAYAMVMDNPAYMGPNSQLPTYSAATDPPPPYKHKRKNDAKNCDPSLVGYGASTLDISFLNDIYENEELHGPACQPPAYEFSSNRPRLDSGSRHIGSSSSSGMRGSNPHPSRHGIETSRLSNMSHLSHAPSHLFPELSLTASQIDPPSDSRYICPPSNNTAFDTNQANGSQLNVSQVNALNMHPVRNQNQENERNENRTPQPSNMTYRRGPPSSQMHNRTFDSSQLQMSQFQIPSANQTPQRSSSVTQLNSNQVNLNTTGLSQNPRLNRSRNNVTESVSTTLGASALPVSIDANAGRVRAPTEMNSSIGHVELPPNLNSSRGHIELPPNLNSSRGHVELPPDLNSSRGLNGMSARVNASQNKLGSNPNVSVSSLGGQSNIPQDLNLSRGGGTVSRYNSNGDLQVPVSLNPSGAQVNQGQQPLNRQGSKKRKKKKKTAADSHTNMPSTDYNDGSRGLTEGSRPEEASAEALAPHNPTRRSKRKKKRPRSSQRQNLPPDANETNGTAQSGYAYTNPSYDQSPTRHDESTPIHVQSAPRQAGPADHVYADSNPSAYPFNPNVAEGSSRQNSYRIASMNMSGEQSGYNSETTV